MRGSRAAYLFDDERRERFDRHAALVDAFMHLAGLDENRLSGLYDLRRMTFELERQLALEDLGYERARVRVSPFAADDGERDICEHDLVARKTDVCCLMSPPPTRPFPAQLLSSALNNPV